MNVILHRNCLKYFWNTKIIRVSVIIVLLIASISVAAIFLFAFLWSVKNGQYKDEISPPVRILFDDATPTVQQQPTEENNTNE